MFNISYQSVSLGIHTAQEIAQLIGLIDQASLVNAVIEWAKDNQAEDGQTYYDAAQSAVAKINELKKLGYSDMVSEDAQDALRHTNLIQQHLIKLFTHNLVANWDKYGTKYNSDFTIS